MITYGKSKVFTLFDPGFHPGTLSTMRFPDISGTAGHSGKIPGHFDGNFLDISGNISAHFPETFQSLGFQTHDRINQNQKIKKE